MLTISDVDGSSFGTSGAFSFALSTRSVITGFPSAASLFRNGAISTSVANRQLGSTAARLLSPVETLCARPLSSDVRNAGVAYLLSRRTSAWPRSISSAKSSPSEASTQQARCMLKARIRQTQDQKPITTRTVKQTNALLVVSLTTSVSGSLSCASVPSVVSKLHHESSSSSRANASMSHMLIHSRIPFQRAELKLVAALGPTTVPDVAGGALQICDGVGSSKEPRPFVTEERGRKE